MMIITDVSARHDKEISETLRIAIEQLKKTDEELKKIGEEGKERKSEAEEESIKEIRKKHFVE